MQEKEYVNGGKKSVGLAIIWNDHILLTHHPAESEFDHKMSIPKGRQETNEAGLDFYTAIRETKEEVGIDIPVRWVMEAPKYEIKAPSGRTIDYYIIHIDDLKQIGMDNPLVHPVQYQTEEVDFASFIPFAEAKRRMYPEQLSILRKVGYNEFDEGGELGDMSAYIVKATDLDGNIHTVIMRNDLLSDPNQKIYEHFLNKGIVVTDSEVQKITFQEANMGLMDAFFNFFRNQTGEEIEFEDTFYQYNQDTGEVKKATIGTLSGTTYEYNPVEMHFFKVEEPEFKSGGDTSLKEGTKIEMEHKDTIKKIVDKKLSPEEGAELIAKDHLEERDDYYDVVKREGLEDGGVVTWKDKYNSKYGFGKDESHSIEDIAKTTGISKNGLQQIYNKGVGAFKTNPESVRPNVNSKEQWGMARVYSAVMGGETTKIDAKELEMKEDGGVIEGQLHSECNEPHGCGEKFEVGDSGKIIEAERDEAVIVSDAFDRDINCPIDGCKYRMVGTLSQIASALNVLGGGKSFDKGAKVFNEDGKRLESIEKKTEAKDTDVDKKIESGSIIINRRSMADKKKYEVSGTPRQIASSINSINGNGVVIEQGGTIKEA